MIRVLLLYYSQSGEARRVAEVFSEGLRDPEIDLTVEVLRPRDSYPFPWKKIGSFFNVLPECHRGPVPALLPVRFDADHKFDLIVLVYQVWFLAPSLPVQGFLKSKDARVLRRAKVLTISVSRKMWQSASETMKELLREHEARHMDNIVVTHQGGDWATLITTPRALLFGKKEGFWKIFPPVGISEKELDRVRQFGQAIVDQKEKLIGPDILPLLQGLGAARVDMRFILAERVGWHCFRWWAWLIQSFGRRRPIFRRVGVYLFVLFLVCGIPIVLPVTVLIRLLFQPVLRPWMTAYARRLGQPSGP